MKTERSPSVFLLLVLLAAATFAQVKPAEYAPDELLVRFAPGRNHAAKTRAIGRAGAELAEEMGDLRWVRVRLPKGTSVEQAIKSFNAAGEVEAVQPNFYYHLLSTPNDALWDSLYGMVKISAPAAWDLTTGSQAVVVADIDTGIRYTHEDLAANMWTNPGEIPGNGVDDDGNGFADDYYGFDFRYNDPDPLDEHGHGTHTAGTIGAVGNNGLGVAGVNWNVKLMAIKIYSNTATDTTSAMLINAYNYVRMMKNRGVNIRVTNNSYGGCSEACGYDQATKDAIDALGDAGVLNVFAAGNSAANNDTPSTAEYPASYDSPSILSVAASDQTDAKPGFSNYGPISVDLAAPGLSIQSTTFSSNSSYGFLSGTSMSAPHVSGAAALLAALNPSLSAASLKATLMNSVDELPAWSGVVRSGGRLNVSAALRNQTVCTFVPSGSPMKVRRKGGIFTVNLTPGKNCDYMVKSNAHWISLMSVATFSGDGALTFRVATSPTVMRSGTISIGGQTFTISQSN